MWRTSRYGRYTVVHPVPTGRLDRGPGGRVLLTGTAARPRRRAVLYAWLAGVLLTPLVLAPLDVGLPGLLVTVLAVAGIIAGGRRRGARGPRVPVTSG